jgi:hypothetical protein
MATEKQISANRANAQKSTGPVSAEGKAIASHNAVKSGLTGQTILLKTDDVAAYHRLIERFINKFHPEGDEESALVQDLADTEWRLARIAPLEASYLAMGRMELAAEVANIEDAEQRDQILEAKAASAYAKDLRNLTLQQSRLNRHRTAKTLEIKELQAKRKEKARHQAANAADYFREAIKEGLPFNLTDFGFEFTPEDMFEYIAYVRLKEERAKHPDLRRKAIIEESRSQYRKLLGEE